MVMTQLSERASTLRDQLLAFMDAEVYPREKEIAASIGATGDRWQPLPIIEELKGKAKAQGLWNLFLPESDLGAGLTNLEYAPLCEIMGRSFWAPEIFNCSAPDTGNMEVLVRYGTDEHKERWLKPLLAGEIRSAFAMTEPAVASSDATNIEMSMKEDGDDYVLNGRKWWTSGAMDPRCKILIVMGKTSPDHPERLAPPPVEARAHPRVPLRAVDVRDRIGSFAEVEQGYTREQAMEEAGRCLRCDVRGRGTPAAVG